jgi:hypothetical protein
MRHPGKILFQLFVKPFYKENSGIFIFVFAMMFFIVSEQSGAGLYEYHYSLCTGMLSNNIFLFSVSFVWLLYSGKCVAFVSHLFYKPAYNFSSIYNSLGKSKRVALLFIVQVWLMLPILVYALFILHCGLEQHFYASLFFVFFFLFSLCFLPAMWYVYLLKYPQKKQVVPLVNSINFTAVFPAYQVILVKFAVTKQKTLWVGLKLFTCGIIYLISRNGLISEPDEIGLLFIFFNFGILANGVIVFRVREFEQTNLLFYRGLPVSYLNKFINYSILYFILLIPEFITLIMLVPKHLEFATAIRFALCSYSLLLLMNSITFIQNFKMKDFLKILLLIFCIQFAFLNTIGLTFLYLLCFILAILFFVTRYYKFERTDYS